MYFLDKVQVILYSSKDEKNVSEVVDYKTISSLACSGLYGFGSYKEMKEKHTIH